MTALEYREMGSEEDELFDSYMKYGFRPERGPTEYDPDDVRRPVGARRGLFRPGEEAPVSVCRHYWLDMRVRGEALPGSGLTSVITPPEHRRGGYVTRLLDEALAEYRERGRLLSVLWPFDYGFYRSFGWDTANDKRTYEFTPSALAAVADRVDGGTYRRLSFDELSALEPVYESHASRYSLTIDRDQAWWRHRVCRAHPEEPFVYLWSRDGEPRSYIIYEFEGDHHERTMVVREFGYTDMGGLDAVLGFCHNHDSQADRIRIDAPDTPILRDRLPTPDDVDCELHTGAMVRIVDVEATLSSLPYPDTDAQITIAVSDDTADWNDDTFVLDVSPDSVTCRAVGDSRDPDVGLDIAALTQLAIGYRSVTELSRCGRLQTASPTVTDTLGELFPKTTVYLPDGF
ncbi:GNAT family N-acetyltransferase [Haloarcula sp. S1CR25-12]|uniref:GNAT family N-acetyltransferase n=1 Tax=Haloarcula saliterrae TaxID=2950534 RepID=A0ABU2FFR1_9EURY|nr:GNAT family N-acetyltransferase [Haloarcula sp. S1CR25-12]MDS0261079.1 GNAT family N-acetyltransferase [Haloarcula sp. S1CR25-12]